MCGITGYVSEDNPGQLHNDLRMAVRELAYRGPDDEGVWTARGVGLGHRRLSILDLSADGHQPMFSRSNRFAMVFNGEVYNFADIRRDLEARGCSFRSSGDSEVVLAALETWGIERAVKRFVGMFAIALWDNDERRLVLIRDRLGVKPLYYGWDGKNLFFGSELKALRAYTNWKVEIDSSALAEYFKFGYINSPRSIYQNVYKLSPGHWLELRVGTAPVVKRYWSVLDALEQPLVGSDDDLTAQLEALMVDAFKLRMVSDVPVGMFLSGGIDSSLVTALLQKHHTNVHTFTIGFDDSAFNEAPHAQRIADHLETTHTERILRAEDAMRILPKWADLYDEPFADQSGIPTYLVSKVASEQVKVVLSADGGDELFSGYNVYEHVLNLEARRERIPVTLRAAATSMLRAFPLDSVDAYVAASRLPRRARNVMRGQLTRRLCRIRDYLSARSSGEVYDTTFTSWGPRGLLLSGAHDRVRELADSYPGQLAEQMCLWDLHNYLPGDILTKVDRASMAASIEGRDPLIDHRIVEFAFRLPLHLRRGALGPKHILRKILYKYVPREMVDRRKQGFGVPLIDWLRGDLSNVVDEYLDNDEVKAQGILDPQTVATTVSAFKRGDELAGNKVWLLLAFQMWRKRWT